jgi:hypothetical protein
VLITDLQLVAIDQAYTVQDKRFSERGIESHTISQIHALGYAADNLSSDRHLLLEVE